MDTIINATIELIFYFVERFSKKEEIIETAKKELFTYDKGGILIRARRNKELVYSPNVKKFGTFFKEIEFEATKSLGVLSDLYVHDRKKDERTIFIDPKDLYSKNFFKDVLKQLKGENDEH